MFKIYKITFWFIIAVKSLTSEVLAVNVPSYVPTNGLIGWWPFNGNTQDESGNGNHGALTGGEYLTDRNSKTRGALGFTSAAVGYVDMNVKTIISDQFSIMMWVRPEGSSTFVGESSTCPGGVSVPMANSNQNWAMQPTNSLSNLGVGLSYARNGLMVSEHANNILVSRLSYQITSTNFNQVIIVYRRDSTFLYFNGTKVRSRAMYCFINKKNLPTPIRFGGSGYSSNFSGALDDIGLWNRALTESEIKGLFNATIANYKSIDNSKTNETILVNGANDVSSQTKKSSILTPSNGYEIPIQNYPKILLARDKFVQIYPYNHSNLNGTRLNIKIVPEMTSGCSTENRIVLECINCLNNSAINYISFDLFYEDCSGIKWKKTVSLPANSGSSISIGGKAFMNNQREQIIYGLDNSNINNGHFTYKAEMAGEIANIRVTNKYEGGTSQPLGKGIQMPSKIYATNGDGTINTEATPAEKNTKVLLTWQGGQLSEEGKWRLYENNDFTRPVYEGNEVFHLFTASNFKLSTLITLTAMDKNGVEYNGKKELKIFTNLRENERELKIESVTIGSQVWQTMNLNVDRFRNGDLIPQARTNEEWIAAGNSGKPAWCYYNFDNSENSKGNLLYNYFAVKDKRGLAPFGWRIPNVEDFYKFGAEKKEIGLIQFLSKIKNSSNIGWWVSDYAEEDDLGRGILELGGYIIHIDGGFLHTGERYLPENGFNVLCIKE